MKRCILHIALVVAAAVLVTACGSGKKDGVWTVVSMETAGEGEDYAKDIAAFCNGDKELEEQYAQTTGASEDSFLPQYQRAAVVTYVQDNNLDIEAYQDFGQDPVSVTD